jgi:hypothetical protein
MVNGLIGLNGTIVLWSVVVAIKHGLEPALILNLNLMALTAVEKTLKHKFAMMSLVAEVISNYEEK